MNKIEDHLLAISKCIFQERNNWKYVSIQQKEKWFFIINRNMSKRFPNLSQLLNNKNLDKSVGMDLWFHFMKSKPYPNWFWSKNKEEKLKFNISEKEYEKLLIHLQVKSEELNFLIKHHKEEIIEELEYLKKLYK